MPWPPPRRHGLTIDTVHFHAGSGWLEDGLPAFEAALAEATRMTRHLMDRGCPIKEVNVGGGLGAPGRGHEIASISTPTPRSSRPTWGRSA